MSTSRRVKLKLGFRNKSAGERVGIARRVIKALGKVPPADRYYVDLEEMSDKLDAAAGDMALVMSLRSQLREALRKRNRSVGELCHSVKRGAAGYVASVGFD